MPYCYPSFSYPFPFSEEKGRPCPRVPTQPEISSLTRLRVPPKQNVRTQGVCGRVGGKMEGEREVWDTTGRPKEPAKLGPRTPTKADSPTNEPAWTLIFLTVAFLSWQYWLWGLGQVWSLSSSWSGHLEAAFVEKCLFATCAHRPQNQDFVSVFLTLAKGTRYIVRHLLFWVASNSGNSKNSRSEHSTPRQRKLPMTRGCSSQQQWLSVGAKQILSREDKAKDFLGWICST